VTSGSDGPDNLSVIRQVYAAFEAQDLEALLALSAPDIVITQDPALPWGGRHVGHEGVTNFALALVGASDSAVTSDSIFEADGQVIQCGRTRGTVRASGKRFDVPEVHVWTLRDGLVVEAHFAIDTAAMLVALG
jgi:ketosteroid isomerase-like protein